jgi:hypothetical protein
MLYIVYCTFKNYLSRAWWYMPIIPATQEVEVGVLQFNTGLDKNSRPYLKNKLKQKQLGTWLKL